MSREYDDEWLRIKRTTKFPDLIINRHLSLNLIVNIIIAATCIWLLDFPLWALPLAFIATDMILIIPHNIVMKLVPKYRESKMNSISWLNKRAKKLEALIKRYTYLVNNKDGDTDEYFDAVNVYKDELKEVEKRINKIEHQKEEAIKEQEEQQDIYKKITNSKMDQIKLVISRLNDIGLSATLESEGISLSGIIEKSTTVKKLLKKKPDCIDRYANTFLLFGTELVEILEDVCGMENDAQIDYVPKIKELITEYEEHLDRTKEKILRSDDMKTNVDINVLLTELRNDK